MASTRRALHLFLISSLVGWSLFFVTRRARQLVNSVQSSAVGNLEGAVEGANLKLLGVANETLAVTQTDQKELIETVNKDDNVTEAREQEKTHIENPRSKVKSVCTESPATRFVRTPPRLYESSHSLSRLVRGPGLSANTSTAICEFTGRTFHFPHAMQDMLRCWSFWQAQSHRKPVLMLSSTAPRFKGRAYLDGFFDALQALNVSIVEANNATKAEPTVKIVSGIGAFAMASLQDAESLRAQIGSLIKSTNNRSDNYLRIGLLNRKGWRSLINIEQIRDALHQKVNASIDIVDFESSSFLDQVEFYQTHHVVISSHGAQLTGINWMNTCSALVELFPRAYYVAAYFRSLAETAGIERGSLYLSDQDPVKETKLHLFNVTMRSKARNVNLCPPIDKVVDATLRMIEARQECLERLQNKTANPLLEEEMKESVSTRTSK